jgi:hypothetical protein
MYRWFGVVPQGLDVLFPFVLFGDFRSLSWRFSWSDFETILFGIWLGMYAWTLCGSFLFDSPPRSVSKGARFWGFRCSRVRGVLCGFSSIPLDLASFGGQNLGYGVPMRCSSYPQSLVQICGAIREIRSWIWGCWPAGAVHPDELRSHRSDQCLSLVWPVQTPVEFCSGECLGQFDVVPCCCCFKFGSVWSSVCLFGRFGVSLSWTGLTGELHQPDRCSGLFAEVPRFHQ